MKILLKFPLFLFFVLIVIGAFSSTNTLLPKDVDDIKSRILIVQQITFARNIQSKKEQIKNTKHDDRREEYKKDLEKLYERRDRINNHLNEMVTKYWTLNDSIVFKNGAEISQLKKEKNKKFAVISVVRSGPSSRASGTRVPTITYKRVEKIFPDVYIYMPNLNSYKLELQPRASFMISFKMLENQVEEIKGSKSFRQTSFYKKSSKKNSSKLCGKELFIQTSLKLKKRSTSEFSISSGKITFVEDNEINKIIEEEKDEFICLSIPNNFKENSSETYFDVTYRKMILNAKTGEVYYHFYSGDKIAKYWFPAVFNKISC